MEEILVKEYRGDIVECIHKGYICIVGDDGKVKCSIGDDNFVTYMRSSAKPIQAIPLIKRNIDEKYKLNDKELTVMTGSHRAEPFHVEALEGIMKKVGIEESELICLPTYPLGVKAKEDILRNNGEKRRIYHNCSGKHLGLLTLCRELKCDTKTYWDKDNEAQKEILKYISNLSNYKEDKVLIGTDGCGVPVFGMPMKNLATIYMKMACPDLIKDEDTRTAVKKITTLMNENYEMVSGTNLICSVLLQDKNIIAKGGAKGVYCFGLKKERLGIAIKVLDGSEEEWPLIVSEILTQIGYENEETIERLNNVFPSVIVNDNEKIVGHSETEFTISMEKNKDE